ncbi:hypothetical protein B0H13DRAFT_2444802 [Mycena leptocephala]|nr:hypothetical protein B0H13DRAFT_2444802 [Mycena leptocephala]
MSGDRDKNAKPRVAVVESQLYQIASVHTVTKTHAEKRRAILIDGLGIPLLQIPLQLLSANKNLNLNRYVMALASIDLLLTTPLCIWVLWVNMRVFGLSPWISWQIRTRCEQMLRWAMFFAYFGFVDEVIKNYCRAFKSVAKRVGYTSAGLSGSVRLARPRNSPTYLPPVAPRRIFSTPTPCYTVDSALNAHCTFIHSSM